MSIGRVVMLIELPQATLRDLSGRSFPSLTVSPASSIIQPSYERRTPGRPVVAAISAQGAGAVSAMSIVARFEGSLDEYQVRFAAWVIQVRPRQCPHCGQGACILWGSYQRWVYTDTERIRIRIERVLCVACGVTDALLPSFLHPHRHYTLLLIQQAVTLALAVGVWGQALVDTVAPYHQPAPSTLREWVWSFALSAEAWLLAWLQQTLTTLDPLVSLDPGPPPAHLLSIPNAQRRAAFIQGWQASRLAEILYASVRARQPTLVFEAETLFAFLLAALGAARRAPRLLWPQATRAP